MDERESALLDGDLGLAYRLPPVGLRCIISAALRQQTVSAGKWW
ncbi:MAG TPA: hypothetical protein VG892_11990 [Terriglobales bacterium]|nr:hypothetical protein [Terriglobales bacterium]